LFKKFRNTQKLKKSNWGRNYGWYIEYEGEHIGELVDYEWKDMFWDSYILKSKHEKWNKILTDENSWNQLIFKFKNKQHQQYATNAFAAIAPHITLNKRISMRGLYLTELK